MRRIQRLQGAASTISISYSTAPTVCPKLAALTCAAERSIASTSEASRLSSTHRFANGLAWSSHRGPSSRRSIFTTAPRAANNEVKLLTETNEDADHAPAEDGYELEEPTTAPVVAGSDLKLPPRNVQKAPRPAEVTDDPDYTPAEDGFGLEEVGGLDGWFEKENNWSGDVLPERYGPEQIEKSPEALEKMLKNALGEALFRKQQGLSPNEERPISAECTESGAVRILGPEPGQETLVTETEGDGWRSISLDDPVFKFMVTKSLQAQSGHRLPDGKLVKINNSRQLFGLVVRPPKPKTLAEELETKGKFEELSNVAVYDRRVTPVDKEKMVGRWKVIVKELEKRKLPVLGSGEYTESIEHKWALSKY